MVFRGFLQLKYSLFSIGWGLVTIPGPKLLREQRYQYSQDLCNFLQKVMGRKWNLKPPKLTNFRAFLVFSGDFWCLIQKLLSPQSVWHTITSLYPLWFALFWLRFCVVKDTIFPNACARGFCQIFGRRARNQVFPTQMVLKSAVGGLFVALRSPQLGFPTVLSTAFAAIESSPQGVGGRDWSAQGCFPAGPPSCGSVPICLGCVLTRWESVLSSTGCPASAGHMAGVCVSEHWSLMSFDLCGSPALSHIVSLALSQDLASALSLGEGSLADS